MSLTSPYLRYLAMPRGYGPTDGLRWSRNGEAIETRDGRTVLFTAMLPPFLEGFAAQRPLIHFAYVLDLLRLLGHGDEPEGMPRRQCEQVRDAFRTGGKNLRNAGAFFGVVCSDMPSAWLAGGSGLALAKWLATSPAYPTPMIWESPEPPPIEAAAFRWMLSEALHQYSDAEIRHWMRHGRAPLAEEPERLAEEVAEVKPPAFTGTLEDLMRQRPRLAGALPLVGTMVSALTLPPRRRAPPELPIGGYADVTNRGEPERLLPSQFALDADEFVRRFAEKELLFFRREEPHRRTRERLTLLLDQGVRTWGTVRLALSAAVLAFRKLADKRGLPFRVRFGSAPATAFDPNPENLTAVADRLEASDLSPNPAGLIDAEVSAEDDEEADVVLLTHPRSLADEGVKLSAAELPAHKRLFALAVDEDGSAQFGQLRGGVAVPISRFRVNFHATEIPPTPAPRDDAAWGGDVEPVPFPFPIGPFLSIVGLAFDADSRHLLVATQAGYLHLWELDGSRLETLPRAFDKEALMVVDAVLGVRGGFVVSGRLGHDLVAAHYDLTERKVKLHRLGPTGTGSTKWYGFADLHAVAVRQIALCRGLDLQTGAMYAEPERSSAVNVKAQHAYLRALDSEFPPPWIRGIALGDAVPMEPYVCADRQAGEVRLCAAGPTVVIRFVRDGKPVAFPPHRAISAQHCADTLAVLFRRRPDEASPHYWYLCRTGREAVLLSEHHVGVGSIDLCRLSPDGRYFAMPTGSGEVTVRVVGEGGLNRLVTAPARLHNNLSVQLGKAMMYIVIGRKRHVLSWKDGALKHHFERVRKDETLDGSLALDRKGVRHPFTEYDQLRFVSVASKDVDVIIDAAGHVTVYDPHRSRVVCIFFARRGNLAAWMPDGTRYGPGDLSGGPSAPDALARIGAALRGAGAPT